MRRLLIYVFLLLSVYSCLLNKKLLALCQRASIYEWWMHIVWLLVAVHTFLAAHSANPRLFVTASLRRIVQNGVMTVCDDNGA